MTIKAIETRYKGYRFRSRLEARWAVFFDDLGLKWEYEPEGFDIDGVRYLPDFRVHGNGVVSWYEIKADGAKSDGKMEALRDARIEEERKRYNLPEFSNPVVYENGRYVRYHVLCGDPTDVINRSIFSRLRGGDSTSLIDQLTVCPCCGSIWSEPECAVDWDQWSAPQEVWVTCWPCDVTTPTGGDNDMMTGAIIATARPHKGLMITTREEMRAALRKISKAATKARSARFEHGERP